MTFAWIMRHIKTAKDIFQLMMGAPMVRFSVDCFCIAGPFHSPFINIELHSSLLVFLDPPEAPELPTGLGCS